MAEKLAIKDVSFHVRTLKTRSPFRFGAFTLREVPLLHLAIEAEGKNGSQVRGFAADNLVPRWFDKSPTKTVNDNITDLLSSAHIAHEAYISAARSPSTVWSIWRDACPECFRRGTARGLNKLVASFGSSLFERALTDAVGRLAGLDLVSMLREDVLGLRPQEIHRELELGDLLSWASRVPPKILAVRHTVGLLDAIIASDRTAASLNDGLPQTLEEYIIRHGLRFFKLKVAGNIETDIERLKRIAMALDRLIAEPYVVTLDGNEQYKSIKQFSRLIDTIQRTPKLERLFRSTAFIEQPLDRLIALDPTATEGLGRLCRQCPIIIDESDEHLDAFKVAIEIGYQGVSTKNCKGIIKSFLNRSLIERLNRTRPEDQRLFMSAEDLMNVPVVPLQQDLTTVRALGITHVERNGHHYVRGLAHCSPREREAAIRLHPDLYCGDEREAYLRITNGQLQVVSLGKPGYGVAFDPDLASMTPLSEWAIDSGLERS